MQRMKCVKFLFVNVKIFPAQQTNVKIFCVKLSHFFNFVCETLFAIEVRFPNKYFNNP